MKIAITSTGPGLDSPIDERFGHARYILIVDTENGSVQTFDNRANMNMAYRSGIQTAQLVANKKVEWVLTGHVGPKSRRVLQSADIKVATGSLGTCRQAIEQFRSGILEAMERPDIKS